VRAIPGSSGARLGWVLFRQNRHKFTERDVRHEMNEESNLRKFLEMLLNEIADAAARQDVI